MHNSSKQNIEMNLINFFSQVANKKSRYIFVFITNLINFA